MNLLICDDTYAVVQSGPGFAILAAPLSVEGETSAVLLAQIDGVTQRIPVHLLPTGDDPIVVQFTAGR